MTAYYLLFNPQVELLASNQLQANNSQWYFRDSDIQRAQRSQSILTPLIPVFTEGNDSYFTAIVSNECVKSLVAAQIASYRAEYLQALSVQKMLLGRSYQLLRWYCDNKFCSRCGTEYALQLHEKEPIKACANCSFSVYPRISPCIITLIYRGDEMLLARAGKFDRPIFSTIAGFIEAGETPEEALHRETYEEVGLQVKNLEYKVSQSWPFPHSLMLGYFAEYESGDIAFLDGEIVEAGWYTKETLPEIPPHGTISRTLIDLFLAR